MSSHNLIQEYFYELSSLFKEEFSEPRTDKLPFQKDTHEWLNYFYSSPIFRHIHLEYYKTDKLCVLHSNIFPKPLIDMPIMGFDMIAIGEKITGLFFDFTPTVTTSSILEHSLKKLKGRYNSIQRKLPEWATFFSNDFYCVTPDASELLNILKDIKRYIEHYLYMGRGLREEYEYNIHIQNGYCKGQQKNDKTLKALAAEIGSADAETFMVKYLFPEIDNL
jgi:hypothetical protein